MLEDVPNRVLGAESSFYDELPSLPLRLRCKFGLSFASLASLMEEMKRRSIDFSPPPLSARPTADEADALLKAALPRAVGDELLLSGISDYMTGLEEAQAN